MVEVPADGLLDALGEGGLGVPAQLACNLGGVDGIAHIVAGTVGDKLDESVVDVLYLALEQLLIFGLLMHDAGDDGDDLLDDVDVALLVKAADVICLGYRSLMENEVDCSRVVFNIQPVAHVLALAINR